MNSRDALALYLHAARRVFRRGDTLCTVLLAIAYVYVVVQVVHALAIGQIAGSAR